MYEDKLEENWDNFINKLSEAVNKEKSIENLENEIKKIQHTIEQTERHADNVAATTKAKTEGEKKIVDLKAQIAKLKE